MGSNESTQSHENSPGKTDASRAGGRVYRPPQSDYRLPPSDYRPPPSDYRPPPTNYRPPPSESRSPPSGTGTMDPKATESVTDDMENLQINVKKSKKKQINILLLGETGVGKSTFINSVFNYLHYQDFNVAERQKLNVLIPATFSMFDKDDNLQTIRIGAADKNESREIGESATQDVRTYTFLIKNGEYQVRLIDTPGMGDTRGIEQDDLNCENILSYISNIHELHAICYLCKPQQTRATSYFQYCVSQIMTRLHADACKNFVFVFTGSKAENYTPGETFQMLKMIADEISKKPAHAKLTLDDNKFCFDNEAFRYLAAVKQGVKLKSEMKEDAIRSWTKATQECWKMIDYITKLKPHHVGSTSAINEARRVIYQLSKPMADIAQLVQDNILVLQRHKHNMDIENNSIQELKEKLYIPSIELQVTKLTQPVTVCAELKCCEIYKVDDRNEYHYKTRCHDPCYLQNVQREVIGAPELMNCAAMNPEQRCNKCGCSYRVHMHVYYFTKKNSVNKPDASILQNINTREDAVQKTKVLIKELEDRKGQYEHELDIITKANAKFAHFLEKNAIAAFTDAYAEYIKYLIIREKSLGKDCNLLNLTALEALLREHKEQKNIFDNAAKEQEKLGREDPITPQIISQTMSELFNLPLNGKSIKGLYESQKTPMKKEHANTEYTHTMTFNKMAQKQQTNKPSNRGKNYPQYNSNYRRNKSEVRHTRSPTPPPSYDASQQQASDSPKYRSSKQPPTDHRPPPADYRSHSSDYRPATDYHPPPADYYSRPPADYRPPPNDYRSPPPDYRSPPSDYHPPPSDYRPPPADYRPPPSDYRSPSSDYRSPPADYRPSPSDYRPPSSDYRAPPADYRPPPNDYRPPPSDYRPPPSDYRPPPADYRPPPADYRPPPNDYRPPPSDYRPPPSDYRPPPSESRPPPSDYRPPPTDYRPPPADYRPPPNDYRPPPSDYRPPPSDYRPPPSESRPPPSDYRPPPTDYRPPPADYHSRPSDYRPPPSDHHEHSRQTNYRHQDNRRSNSPNRHSSASSRYNSNPNRQREDHHRGRGRGGIQRNYRNRDNNQRNDSYKKN